MTLEEHMVELELALVPVTETDGPEMTAIVKDAIKNLILRTGMTAELAGLASDRAITHVVMTVRRWDEALDEERRQPPPNAQH